MFKNQPNNLLSILVYEIISIPLSIEYFKILGDSKPPSLI